MDPTALRDALLHNDGPLLVAATAGTTDTGQIDPLTDIADLTTTHGADLHIDAAYGGPLLFSPTHRHTLRSLHRAHSVTLDLHKLGWQPASAGILAVPHHHDLNPLHHHAPYLNADDDTDAGPPRPPRPLPPHHPPTRRPQDRRHPPSTRPRRTRRPHRPHHHHRPPPRRPRRPRSRTRALRPPHHQHRPLPPHPHRRHHRRHHPPHPPQPRHTPYSAAPAPTTASGSKPPSSTPTPPPTTSDSSSPSSPSPRHAHATTEGSTPR